MILVDESQYRQTGYLYPKDFNAQEYVDIKDQEAIRFRYRDSKRSTYTLAQQLTGMVHTNEGKVIEVRSAFLFHRGDRVVLNSGEYEVVQVDLNEDREIEVSDYWGIIERNIQTITLS